MCGIIGIVSDKNVENLLITGLERLEYRGYDSAGIAVLSDKQKISRVRAIGKLSNLKNKLLKEHISGCVGIGHTRWATHGKPTENNAHPMMSKNVALVHNGIIENYKELKFVLENEGVLFDSQTDTEVIVQLIQKYIDKNFEPLMAVAEAMKVLDGSFSIAVIFDNLPNTIIAARRKSSLAVGNGEKMCVGSDAVSLSAFCDQIMYLEDNDIAVVTLKNIDIYDVDLNKVSRKSHDISEQKHDICKGDYEHFMLKEIMDQPTVIRNTLLFNKTGNIFHGINRILILACGSSYYAGMVAKYWFEQYLKIPTDVEVASEYRYRSPVIVDNILTIAISQSGETLDTLAAIEYVKSHSNCKTLAIVNVKNSAIARISDLVYYTEAGVEIGVASTKTFTSQLTILAMLAFANNDFITNDLQNLPSICEKVLSDLDVFKDIASQIYQSNNAIYLGRGILYPIALEGALKLKEISYIHAEGFAAGEMKHGPISLIDDNMPVICLCPSDDLLDKTLSNLQEAFARGKKVIVFTDEMASKKIPNDIENKVVLPRFNIVLSPIIYSIPLQLIAYYSSVMRGEDVDRPRNLAKSVTVE